MLILRKFTIQDAPFLQKHRQGMSLQEAEQLITDWNSGLFQGKYFEMYAILADDSNGEIVGTVSLYEHTSTAVSPGIEIIKEYRGKGYGTEGMKSALAIAAENGWKIAISQVRTDNVPSLRLHKSLDFEIADEYINKKGNRVYCLLKSLV